MKKRFLLAAAFALSAIISTAYTRPTQAMTVDENGERWWTVEELIPIAQEINNTVEDICGHDFSDYECLRDETFKLVDSDGKYQAADMLNEIMIMLTDVKPSQNTFKVLFNNEDHMLKWMGEAVKKQDLSRFLIVWRIEEDGENFKNFTDTIWGGGEFSDDWHQVYGIDKNSTAIKAGIEVELTGLPTADLTENESGIFYYTAVAGMSNATGILDYSSCIKSPNYQEGMGCKLKISEKSERAFEPYYIAESTSESVDDTLKEPSKIAEIDDDSNSVLSYSWIEVKQDGDQSTGQTTEKSAATLTANSDNTGSSDEQNLLFTNAKSASTESLASQLNTNDIEIPNSGNTSKKDNTFPWWILVLILGCVSVLVWLFWPKREKELKKF